MATLRCDFCGTESQFGPGSRCLMCGAKLPQNMPERPASENQPLVTSRPSAIDDKPKVDGIRVIIDAGTELKCCTSKNRINLIKPLDFHVPIGTRVKVGAAIFIVVDEFHTPNAKPGTMEKVKPVLEVNLAKETEIKFNIDMTAVLSSAAKVKIPKNTAIQLPAKTKLYHAATMTRFILDDDTKVHFANVAVAKKKIESDSDSNSDSD